MAKYDVIILGAGPAGSTAALLAVRLRWRVLLLEQQRFPRRKVCGGCLSAAGTRRLQALLRGRALPGVPERTVTFVTAAGRALRYRSDAPGRLVPRDVLDSTMLSTAEAEGAIVRQGMRGIPFRSGNDWAVRTAEGISTAAVVLVSTGLTGARTLMPKSDRAQDNRERSMMGWQWTESTIPAGLEIGDVEMHWLLGGYIGLARTSPSECNVALAATAVSSPSDRPVNRSGSMFQMTMSRLYNANPKSEVWSRLPLESVRPICTERGNGVAALRPDAERPKGAAGFPIRPAQASDGNLLCIGDAAGYAEPFAGDGINLAMLSAELAIRACQHVGITESRRSLSHLLAPTYARLMARTHAPRMLRTRLVGSLLRRRWLHHVDRCLPIGWPTTMLGRLVGCIHAGW